MIGVSVIGGLSRKARMLGLGATLACSLLSCAEEEQPEMEQRLEVDDSGALPSVSTPVQTAGIGESPQFSVPFRSEDAGEPLIGRLFLDYDSGQPVILGFAEARPGYFDDDRDMLVSWNMSRAIPAGCYTITMTLTHADNYSREDFRPIDSEQTAFVTWYVVHDIDPSDATVDCFFE